MHPCVSLTDRENTSFRSYSLRSLNLTCFGILTHRFMGSFLRS
ncbi:Hypothetical protein Cp267_1694 [Corynebacterium pseudotuberculosis 267]|nr:Hypothetical protein Cp267_1694 [Corynebacterium pseudotuberculosis 267]